jgi:hypothetical protein
LERRVHAKKPEKYVRRTSIAQALSKTPKNLYRKFDVQAFSKTRTGRSRASVYKILTHPSRHLARLKKIKFIVKY